MFNQLKQKYSKFKIINYDGNSSNYSVDYLDDSNSIVYSNLILNQVYLTSEGTKIEIKNNQNNSWICAHIRFFD